MPLRIGSLFSGYGGLDLAVEAFFGARTVWHSQYEPPDKRGRPDLHQYAARILAHHWPGVPNLGDITTVDWDQVLADHGPVDILTGGFPCTDVSLAGQRAGLNNQTRSGLWAHMAHAIAALQPNLVVIENVPGLLSAPADRGMGPDAPSVDGASGAELHLRALGAVLGDLAELGLDAEWTSLRASEIGACHQRDRVFILAWPADARGPRLEVGRLPGLAGGAGQAALHAESVGRWNGQGIHHGVGAAVGRTPVAVTDQLGPHRPRTHRARRHEPAHRGLAATCEPPDWGVYEPAIRRWEHVTGRTAPRPTDDHGRLAPQVVEWMMGLPAGWITDAPLLDGMTAARARNAQLKAGGNGVVPQQAYAALAELWHRAAPAAA
ncbi:DNA cytosine methyltransferase [Kitasatospora sp. NPDC059408]|uniref:DNA cytosine methyltransferase n=1 Tax=Kitasatospora sp. NPDC059408 TaxID=3346823 RepID=UPI0036C53FD1